MNEVEDKRTAFRVTAFLRVKPADYFPTSRVASWLGEHTFTALYNTYNQSAHNTSWNQCYTDPDGGSVFSPNDALGNARRIMNYVVYLSDQNLTTLSSPSQVRLQRMQNQQLWNPGQTSILRTIDPVTGNFTNATLNTGAFASSYGENSQHVKSYAANWNAYLFDRHLVGLAGWRRDDAYSAGYNALTGADELADRTNMVLTSGGVTQSANTFSWSAVAHVPERFLPHGIRLSAHYGVSQNFSVGATPMDFYGNKLPASSGHTKEYGLTANLFSDKLVARVNWFETDLANRLLSGTANVYNRFVNEGILKLYGCLLEAEYHGFKPPTTDPVTGVVDPGTPNYGLVMQGLADFRKLIPASLLTQTGLNSVGPNGLNNRTTVNMGDTDDMKAKGLEIELVYNPLRNWRISASVAKQQTVQTNYAPRMATLMAATDALIGPKGSLAKLSYFNDASTNPPTYISGPLPTRNSVAEWFEANIYSVYRLYKQQEGRVSDEQRKWRLNVVTNYDFSSGRLKGFGVGAAYRWQDGAAIGYPSQLVNGQLVADINHPHLAPSEVNVDGWVRYRRKLFSGKVDWQVEFRVINLNTNADQLIPVQSTRDQDYRVAVWRVGPPRTWRLSNSFRF